MSFRKVIWFLHLTGGLAGALVLIALGGSGAVLVFESEIDHGLNGKLRWVEPAGERWSLDRLRERVESAHPGKVVTSFSMPVDERQAWSVSLRGQPGIYVNPYTSAEMGSVNDANLFTRKVHQFHTNLLLGPTGETIGVIGACVLLMLAVTGLVLWWPLRRLRVRTGNSGRQTNSDLHIVLGFYSSAFMLLFALTAMVIHWEGPVKNLLNGFTHEQEAVVPKEAPPALSAVRRSPEELRQAAQAAVPGAWVTTIQGIGGNAPVRVIMKFPEDRTPAGRTNLYLDPATGAVLFRQDSRTAPLATRVVKLWNREIHTGDIGGWPTRILAFLASLSLPLLSITGPLTWLGRVRRWRRAGRD